MELSSAFVKLSPSKWNCLPWRMDLKSCSGIGFEIGLGEWIRNPCFCLETRALVVDLNFCVSVWNCFLWVNRRKLGSCRVDSEVLWKSNNNALVRFLEVLVGSQISINKFHRFRFVGWIQFCFVLEIASLRYLIFICWTSLSYKFISRGRIGEIRSYWFWYHYFET